MDFVFDIKPFSGENDDVEWFIGLIKDIKKVNRWDDNIALIFLKTKLVGTALSYVSNSPDFLKKNFDNACSILVDYFKKSVDPLLAINNFQSITLQDNETITSLSRRLKLAAFEAFPNTPLSALNNLLVGQLYRALPMRIKQVLYFEPEQKFDVLVKKASHFVEAQENLRLITVTDKIGDLFNAGLVTQNDAFVKNYGLMQCMSDPEANYGNEVVGDPICDKFEQQIEYNAKNDLIANETELTAYSVDDSNKEKVFNLDLYIENPLQMEEKINDAKCISGTEIGKNPLKEMRCIDISIFSPICHKQKEKLCDYAIIKKCKLEIGMKHKSYQHKWFHKKMCSLAVTKYIPKVSEYLDQRHRSICVNHWSMFFMKCNHKVLKNVVKEL